MKLLLNKKSTKYFALINLLFGFVFLPIIVAGQTTDTSSDWDGSSDWGSDRWERVREYRRQSNDLQQKIDALGSTVTASVFMPVLFGVGIKDISPNFGEPRSGGRLHEGEDIIAVKGTPIVSPTPAVVIRAGSGGTEGNYVYTANPGGETFVYFHLDRIGEGIARGVVLAQGSLIGYVGDTGNASGGPAHLHFEIHNLGAILDPFPRLTREFSLQEKMLYLSAILTQALDSATLSQFLVNNFRSTFVTALAASIPLPLPIMNALALLSATPTPTSTVNTIPSGDLSIGSSGPSVVTLQQYLIQTASGPATSRLALAGATGYFGPITKDALVEFQVAVGISPASGYYGPLTRAFIAGHSLGTLPPPAPTSPTIGTLTRDLYRNVVGEDVRTLQKLLNTKGFFVSSIGAGSPGNETTYFGPATESAVIRFQIARGILPSVGYVGPLTRAALAL